MRSIFSILTIAFCLLLAMGGLVKAENITIIAEVNGKPVSEGNVWRPVAWLELHHPNVDAATLTEIDLREATRRLQNQIKRILWTEAIEAHGIEPTPEEVEEALQIRLAEVVENTGRSLEENLQIIQRQYLIVDALRVVHENPAAMESIYAEMLEPAGIEEHHWKVHAATYLEKPERIDELEANIPKTVEDTIEQTRAGVTLHLKSSMMDQYFLDMAGNQEDAEALKAQYLLEALAAADVVVHDEQLVGAVDDLKNQLSDQAQGT